MATFYSDQFATELTTDEVAAFDPAYRASTGDLGGHLVYSVGTAYTLGTTAADSIRMIRGIHSSQRLWSLTCYCPSTPSAGIADIGLYLSGFNHDGAVVDIDLFEDGQSLTSGLAETDVFLGTTGITAADRGKTMWELADLGAASYGSDPNLFFDICFDMPTGIVTASAIPIRLVAGFLVQG